MSYVLYAYHYLGKACRQGAAAEVDAERDPSEDDRFSAIARRSEDGNGIQDAIGISEPTRKLQVSRRSR